MPPRNLPKLAEHAAEHWLRSAWGCTSIARAVTATVKRGPHWYRLAEDIFDADVVGKSPGGDNPAWRAGPVTVYAQVTTGKSSAVSARRRKLERHAWAESDVVLLLEVRWDRGGARGSLRYWFRVHEWAGGAWVVWPDFVVVPREWLHPWEKS